MLVFWVKQLTLDNQDLEDLICRYARQFCQENLTKTGKLSLKLI